jgi:hypothetical protein
MRAILIQGDSVRMTWGADEPREAEERRPIRRKCPVRAEAPDSTSDPLRIRLAEELDYARRMLDAAGDVLAADPITLGRHGLSLQALDKVGQMISHIADVIRSSDPESAVDRVCMGDLRARLQRHRAL